MNQSILSTPSSPFDDVWSRAEEMHLCARCAAEVEPLDRKCSSCGLKLEIPHFQYERPSTHLYIYWVLVLGASVLFLAQAVLDQMGGLDPAIVMTHSGFALLLGIAATFLLRRGWWSHILALVTLFISGLWVTVSWVSPEMVAPLLTEQVSGTPLEAVGMSSLAFGLDLLRILEIGAVAGGLLYGVFMVGADFSRDTQRLEAVVDRRITSSSVAYTRGERFARRGLWASAILNWRKAVALDPYRLLYYLELSQAYARLGYYERGLDVLKSAYGFVNTDTAKKKIETLRRKIEAKANTSR